MKRYNFSSDLILKYPILEDTEVVLSDAVNFNSVQEVLLNLLPDPSEVKDTKARLRILRVTLFCHIAYWDLIFEYPNGYYPYPLMEYVQNQTIQLEDSFDHYHSPYLPPSLREKDQTIFKISFKVG